MRVFLPIVKLSRFPGFFAIPPRAPYLVDNGNTPSEEYQGHHSGKKLDIPPTKRGSRTFEIPRFSGAVLLSGEYSTGVLQATNVAGYERLFLTQTCRVQNSRVLLLGLPV